MSTIMSKEDFYKKCEYHDWTFACSDDSKVYRAGKASHEQLEKLAQSDPVFLQIFTAFDNFVFGNAVKRPQLSDF